MLVARLMEPWLIALISAIASGSVTVIGAAIWFGRNTVTKDDLIASTATMTAGIHELRSEIDSHSREVGETITSLRTHLGNVDRDTTAKITEVELYVRDTFVRRDSWHTAMNQLQERWAAGEKAAEERSLRLEVKLDKIVERLLVGDK
jgi:hypothetical protein